MKKRRSNILYAIILSLFLSGCSDVSGKLLIIQGNFHVSRNRYDEAISSYLRALECEEAAPYAKYGLGNVYFTLGEEKASLSRYSLALDLLETVPPATNRELRYRIHYNTGVVLFSEGDFAGAVSSFREALRIDGGRIEAKRNLELSIRSNSRERTSGGGARSGDTDNNESIAILTEYIRQREINQWRSREWPEEEDTAGPDY